MFSRVLLFTTLVILEITHSLPLEEKIEPVELFHRCIEAKRDKNEPEKSPVLLLHGLLASHRRFDDIDQLIANRTKRRVCSLDLRNHGNSPWNNRSDIAAFAADIGHFLDQQNITKVNFIGESLGGKTAIHYTLNHPDRVDSLIAVDVRPNGFTRAGFLLVKFGIQLLNRLLDSQPVNLTESEVKEWGMQQIYKMLNAQTTLEIPKNISNLIDLRCVDGKWTLKHNMDLLNDKINKPEEMWTKSSGIYTGPTIFIYGTFSLFKVGNAKDEILKLFPNTKLIPFEGAGHIIQGIYPEFDDIVVKFLNELH